MSFQYVALFFDSVTRICAAIRHKLPRAFDLRSRHHYHAPAMGNPLTDRVPPAELAQRRQVIELKDNLSNFPRLSGIVKEDLAALSPADRPADWRRRPVDIRLRFDWADTRREYPAATGSVSVRVPAVCQRCLEPFELTLDADVGLLLSRDEGSTAEDGRYEVWEIDQDTIRPLDIVEEILIMAIPLSASHDNEQECGLQAEQQIEDTVRPFADLRAQMQDNNETG